MQFAILTSLVLCGASPVIAADLPQGTPLLTRVTGSGFAPEPLQIGTRCDIYADKVVVKVRHRWSNPAVMETVYPLKLTGSFASSIAEASEGPISVHSAPSDGPALIYQAYEGKDDGGVQNVDLGSYSGNMERTNNESMAALGLRKILDLYCPPLS